MNTLPPCDLCHRPQPFLWPGKENLCPDCFRATLSFDEKKMADMIADAAKVGGCSVSLAALYDDLKQAESDYGEAEDDLSDARKRLEVAGEDCIRIEAQIEKLRAIGMREVLTLA